MITIITSILKVTYSYKFVYTLNTEKNKPTRQEQQQKQTNQPQNPSQLKQIKKENNSRTHSVQKEFLLISEHP